MKDSDYHSNIKDPRLIIKKDAKGEWDGVTQPENMEEPELNLEEGSAEVTLTDVYAMFYLMLKQNQKLKPGSKISFDLNAFKTLPKKVAINFLRESGHLFAWIPGKPSDRKKSRLILPEHKIVTVN